MPLILYGHPFFSDTQKALIALYENATPFAFRSLDPDSPGSAAEWLQRWPLRKFPLLVDGERSIVETSIIIEYLPLAHPGPVRLLPDDPMAALGAAAPALFYADWPHPIGADYPAVTAYRARLLARPSFARAVDEARRFRKLFPLGAPAGD